MNRFYSMLTAGVMGMAALATPTASAIGWPSNYQGVMLQGFYWDSYKDTKWTNLEAQADELSKYFKLIWIPNSGKCDWMGYMPQYWFTNHNSAFGTEEELLSMISTFKGKGTGFIADVVINHRNGVTNWYDFPVEEWNGKTWKIGLEGICSNDEMAYATGQPKPTGNPDTGDNFDGCRDLDHTNANVQENCKNYVLCLKEKYGYVGTRYDMVKGYGGQYNKIYNEYADVEYSVGEYWDANYDAVAGWINATGKTSAAFDFPCKYALNEAFSSGDMTKLVWKANGTTDQPAGMIHCGYPRYSVTFVDNHDTYRDGSKFTGNVIAANAFILMSPGTPCVFLPHYQAHKKAIQELINIRNSAGIHNESPVKVLRSSRDCYMAEVTGKNGKVVVKIGGAMASPSGYSDSDIKAAGNDYCVWTKTNVQGGGNDDNGDNGDNGNVSGPTPASLYLLGNVKGASWSTTASPAMTKSGDKFTITATFETAAGETYCFFNFADALGADWDELNADANRYGAAAEGAVVEDNSTVSITKYTNNVDASNCKSWKILPGTYMLTVDFSTMKLTIGENQGNNDDNNDDNNGDDNNDDVTSPASLYLIGDLQGDNHWDPANSPAMTKKGNAFTITATFEPSATNTHCSFSFTDGLGATWDVLNGSANRYGPDSEDKEMTENSSSKIVKFPTGDDAWLCTSWKILPGTYTLTVDFSTMTLTVGEGGNGDDNNDDNGDIPVDMPESFYILGHANGNDWDYATGVEMTKNGGSFNATVDFVIPAPLPTKADEPVYAYFSFAKRLGSSWEDLNVAGNRFAPAADKVINSEGDSVALTESANPAEAKAYSILPGKYDIEVNWAKKTISFKKVGESGVNIMPFDTDESDVYFNLQGVRVAHPEAGGIYIRVKNGKATKLRY
ncbi:MAG: hypothetical protein K2H46_09840 [Muribaculaceae bacterium]|nr:hypothetical protein [Muribaculaceae bacterium]